MASNTQKHEFKVGINQTQVKQGAAELERSAKELQKAFSMVDKIKGLNGGRVTQRNYSAMTNISSQAISNLNRSIDTLAHLITVGRKNQDTYGKSKRNNYNSLKLLEAKLDKIGKDYGGMSGKVDVQELGKVLTSSLANSMSQMLRNGQTTGNKRGVTMYDRVNDKQNIQSIRGIDTQYKNALNKLTRQVDSNKGDMDTARNTQGVGYNKDRSIESRYKITSNNISQKRNQTNLELMRQRSLQETSSNAVKLLSDSQGNDNLTSKQRESIQNNINSLNKEMEARLKTIADLKNYSKSLEGLYDKNEMNHLQYSTDKADDTVKVSADPNSLRGRFLARSFSIIGAASKNTQNAIEDSAGKGNTLRSSQYDMYGSNVLANGNSVNDYPEQLGKAKGKAYGNLSGQEFNTLATAYTGSTGRTTNSQVLGAERIGGNLARSGGFGVQNTADLFSASGNLGVRSNKDFQDLGNSLVGAIKDAGLSGKSTEEIQGFNQILQSLQGQNLSARQQAGIGNIYTGLGKGNSVWQGQAGATAMQQMQSGISGSFNNPLMRMAFTGGQSQYQGLNGMAKAYGDMQNPLAHPEQTQGMLNNLVNLSGGSKDVAAMRFSQQTGMTYKQAQGAISAAQSGNLTKWASENKSASGAKDLKHNESRYNKSGVATIKTQNATIDAASVKMSADTDWYRSAKNETINKHPVLSSVGSGIAQGLSQVAMDSMIRTAIGGKGSIITDTIGGIGDALKDTKLGGKVFNAGSKVAGTGRGLLAKGAAWFGGTAIGSKVMPKILARNATRTGEVASDVSKASTVASDVSKASTVASDVSKASTVARAGSEALPTLTRGLSAGSKLFGKVMPVASVAINGADAANSLASKKKGDQERGKGLLAEMGTGAGIGAMVGGAPGALIGAGIGATVDMIPNASKTIGKGIDYLNPFKTTTAKAATVDSKSDKKKSGYETKAEKWISENKKLIDGYNKMLDKMTKTAALMKNSLNGKGSSSDDDSDITSSGTGTAGVEQWRSKIKAAAKRMGQKVSNKQVDTILKLIGNESGGDQAITGIDDGDGTGPATGLMQYKKSTFAKYAVDGHKNIKNGYDQLLAFFNNSNWASDIGTGYNGKDGEWRGQASGPSGSRIHNTVPHAIGGEINRPQIARLGEGGMHEFIIPTGNGERSQGKSILDHAANALGMNISNGSSDSSKNTRNNNKTTNVSPTFNISVSGNASSDAINNVKQQIVNSANKAVELMRQKADYYSNDIV